MEDMIIEFTRQALILILWISAPALLTSVAIGFIVSLLQTVTQIQDQTLSFVPKIVAVFVVILCLLAWMMNQVVSFSLETFSLIEKIR